MSEVANQILDQAPAQAAPLPITGTSTDAAPKDGQVPPAHQDDPRVASKLSVLMQRERRALEAEARAKSSMKEYETTLARIKEFEDAKGSPLKAIEKLGYSYDDVTKAKLLDGEVPPEVQIRQLKEELEAFKSGLKQEKQSEAELKAQEAKTDAEAREKSAVSSFKSNISTYLNDNAARYELIAFEGQQDLVYEVIDEHWSRTIDPETGAGKVMDIKEAADKVEAFLEKKYDDSKKLNKIQALWSAVPKANIQALKQQAQASQPPRTLTNQLSATPSSTAKRGPITDEERIAKAIAFAKQYRP